MSDNYNGRTYSCEVDVQPSTSRVIRPLVAGPATLAVHANGDGVSAFVELTISSDARLASGTARWVPADGFGESGTVSGSAVLDIVPSNVTAVRVSATGGVVAVEVLQ
ncbi:hypothetical protein D3C71_328570 [compost metagenome]